MVWRGRSHRDFGSAATSWRRQAFTLAALLAVFLQAFVVQTHIHAPVAPLALSYGQPGDSVHADQHASAHREHVTVCAICQALAASGSAITPATTLVVAAKVATQAAVLAIALAPRSHSHSWQSRAPPIRL